MKIKLSSYGRYSGNYGTNSLKVTINSLTLFFSYETIVAFQDGENALKVIHNQWGATTGKHLNFIDGGCKSNRLSEKEFTEELEKTLRAHNLEMQ